MTVSRWHHSLQAKAMSCTVDDSQQMAPLAASKGDALYCSGHSVCFLLSFLSFDLTAQQQLDRFLPNLHQHVFTVLFVNGATPVTIGSPILWGLKS